ncbi:MAG: hypothetical protein IIW99_09070 [Treponema sp.]|nr:hypothetical protein [Treponema sp.]
MELVIRMIAIAILAMALILGIFSAEINISEKSAAKNKLKQKRDAKEKEIEKTDSSNLVNKSRNSREYKREIKEHCDRFREDSLNKLKNLLS